MDSSRSGKTLVVRDDPFKAEPEAEKKTASAQTQASATCDKLEKPNDVVVHQEQKEGKWNLKISLILRENERGT